MDAALWRRSGQLDNSPEYNLSGYYVERGIENGHFKDVSGLLKPGSSAYSFTDKNVSGGTYFYRLRIVDIDGTTKYKATW